jgi:hypothetical protein
VGIGASAAKSASLAEHAPLGATSAQLSDSGGDGRAAAARRSGMSGTGGAFPGANHVLGAHGVRYEVPWAVNHVNFH